MLGAGLYFAQGMFKATPAKVDADDAELADSMLETPREMIMHEARENGIIAPRYNNIASRVPWNTANPPQYVWQADDNGPMDQTLEKSRQVYANRWEHLREDVQEQLARSRQFTMTKTGTPLWHAFTRDLQGVDANSGAHWDTNLQGMSYMPRNPTDMDWTNAGAIGKIAPPNPTLFTPDANYMTAPGLPFRYGGNAV
jgi:hypothetical protein